MQRPWTRRSTAPMGGHRRPAGAAFAILLLLTAVIAAPAAARHPAPVSSGALEASSAALGRDGSPSLVSERLAGRAAPDHLDVVVLMCDFADSLMFGRHGEVPGDFPPPAQTEFLYSAHDDVYFTHLLDDVAVYFDSVSGGAFALNVTVVPTVANLPHPMGWYGDHPEEGEQKMLLVRDTVDILDDLVDFSLFDTVMVIHAGAGEETDILGDSPEQVYSSYLSPEDFVEALEEEILEQPWIPCDDVDEFDDPVRIEHVLVLPETEYQDPAGGLGGYFGSLGVYCFEVGLRLGMLSLSDFTPSGFPDSQGIGQLGLMGYGLFAAGGLIPSEPCAFNRMLMGWVEPLEVDPDAGATHVLNPAEHPGMDPTLARIALGPSEYWLLEYRLQDVDGNNRFSFGDDVNGNGIPDFYRFDDPLYSPYQIDPETETFFIDTTFDPAVHVDERLLGSEWDFYLTDNAARPDDVKGAGSGLLIWHIDEGVIAQALLSERNVFNADPERKSVDLEEADGIQDLDSNRPSAWWLGGDEDSFRGEDVDAFGPDTTPSSDSAGGARTGVIVDQISAVVVDSTAVDPDTGGDVIDYAEQMSFRCRREAAAGAPAHVATVDLPGVDLSGSHLLAVDLDGPADGDLEIVAVGDGGAVFAWNADLTPWLEGGDPNGMLAAGKRADSEPAIWTGPPAAADMDGDGDVEIVIVATDGIYVFEADGTELFDGDGIAESIGLAVPPHEAGSQLVGAPLLVDGDLAIGGAVAPNLVVALAWRDDDVEGGTGTYTVMVHDLQADAVAAIPGSDVAFSGHPDLAGPTVFDGEVVAVGYADGFGSYVDTPGAVFEGGLRGEFEGRPGSRPILSDEDGVLLTLADGGCVRIDDEGAVAWDDRFPVRTPLAPGPAYASDDVFVKTGLRGAPATGWPLRPRVPLAVPDTLAAAGPVVWSESDEWTTVYTARDGRLFAVDEDGDVLAGWPLAGPGETAGTPLLADLDGEPGLELVTVGTMKRLTGRDPGAEEPDTESTSRLVAWDLVGTETAVPVWSMWGGDAARSFTHAHETPDVPSQGELMIESTVHLYPAPSRGSWVAMRAALTADGSLQATLYNLEGEEVRRAGPVPALAGEPAEVVLDVDGLASGTYLCRLEAVAGARSQVVVRPAPITH